MHKKVICLGLCAVFLAVGFAADAQQQAKIYKIGWLGSRPAVREDVAARGSEIIRRELRALGYIEGKNLAFEYRSAEGEPNRLPALADELVRLKVDVLVMSTPSAALAAKNATRRSPSFFYWQVIRLRQGWLIASLGLGELSPGSPPFRRCWPANDWS